MGTSTPDTTPQIPRSRPEPSGPRHRLPLGGDTARNLPPPAYSLSAMVLQNAGGPQTLRLARKPSWLRARLPGGAGYRKLKSIIDRGRLKTVCQEATCPNIAECWERGTATIMILGDICTRSCGFCNVRTGRPDPADLHEPRRVAASLRELHLRHVVLTCVDRDDLPDGGAAIWAETIERVHEACPQTTVEALVGDFGGDPHALRTVIESRPEILAHNMETVRRMHPTVRPQARYERSLRVLQQIKDAGLTAKTGLMVGIGERDEEVIELLEDVQDQAGTDVLTIGQYLQPTRDHLPVDRWVRPAQFLSYKREALARGFKVVESGPLVRSSYHAEEQAARLS